MRWIEEGGERVAGATSRSSAVPCWQQASGCCGPEDPHWRLLEPAASSLNMNKTIAELLSQSVAGGSGPMRTLSNMCRAPGDLSGPAVSLASRRGCATQCACVYLLFRRSGESMQRLWR